MISSVFEQSNMLSRYGPFLYFLWALAVLVWYVYLYKEIFPFILRTVGLG